MSAKQIADWIVRYSWGDLGVPVDPMSLEKLVYYSQSFHLVIHDAPLFPDEILAWQNGPVVPAVYKQYAGFGWSNIIPSEDAPLPALSEVASQLLKEVVSFFGRYTATRLSQATHLELPWLEAREGLPAEVPSAVVISQLAMKAYYRSLIADGEAALSRHNLLGVISEPRWASMYVAGICVRRMAGHPLYDAAMAATLSQTAEPSLHLDDEFYAPPRKKDFVQFPKGTDIDSIIKNSH